MMRSVSRLHSTPTRYLVRATLLLVGLLGVGYGYFNDSRVVLFAGALLIVANVLPSVVALLTGKEAK